LLDHHYTPYSRPNAPVEFGFSEFFKYVARFSGRIGRTEFWVSGIVLAVLSSVLEVIAGSLLSAGTSFGMFFGVIVGLGLLFLMWSSFSFIVRRWHDRGKSGWWILIGLIPIVGPIWALIECGFLPATEEAEWYGFRP
jgi:uncharacterized membrane protein YhaH (DUF805 family)